MYNEINPNTALIVVKDKPLYCILRCFIATDPACRPAVMQL